MLNLKNVLESSLFVASVNLTGGKALNFLENVYLFKSVRLVYRNTMRPPGSGEARRGGGRGGPPSPRPQGGL